MIFESLSSSIFRLYNPLSLSTCNHVTILTFGTLSELLKCTKNATTVKRWFEHVQKFLSYNHEIFLWQNLWPIWQYILGVQIWCKNFYHNWSDKTLLLYFLSFLAFLVCSYDRWEGNHVIDLYKIYRSYNRLWEMFHLNLVPYILRILITLRIKINFLSSYLSGFTKYKHYKISVLYLMTTNIGTVLQDIMIYTENSLPVQSTP